ncbi:MAG: ribonuclease P protein component [Bdellovibrionia bacterium]
MENNPLFLKRSSEFNRIKDEGKRYWVTNWLLFNYTLEVSEASSLRVGVTASRKVGSAVVRNKLKRWTRFYFQDLPEGSEGYKLELNIIFKPIDKGFYKGLSYAEYKKSLDLGLKRIFKNVKI